MIVHHISISFMLLLIITQSLSVANQNQRISDGTLAVDKQFPHQVAIFKNKLRNIACGGSIINKNYVLTSAYFVFGWPAESLFMRYGTINYRSGRKATFNQIIIHEEYKSYIPKKFDIAILQLEHPLVLDDYAKIIPLRKTRVPVGVTVTISGFGEPSTGELRYMETNVFDCPNENVGIFCFKNNDNHGNVCGYGDWGGPAIYEDELIGISLKSSDCNARQAGGFDEYTSVPFYYNWIIKKIGSNETVSVLA